MRVFIAGATGAMGSCLVALLASAGHTVIGLTRHPAKAGVIRQGGGDPVIADALNRAAIVAAGGQCQAGRHRA
jgi:nucleoside-diphosphate-sugar epimerase